MTIETNWYVMDGKLGVDLNSIVTSVTLGVSPAQPEYPGPPAQLGDRVQGNNGSEWMFVRASATISAFNFIKVGISFAAENFIFSTAASTTADFVYGFAQFRIPASITVGSASGGVANAGDFFWALMKANGGIRANLDTSVSVAPGARLYIDASVPGWITTSITINAPVGLVVQATAVGADNGAPAAMECALFTYPFPTAIVSLPPVSLTA